MIYEYNMATYDFNSGKSKIMELINEASLLLKGVPDVLAATRTEDRGKLATWASDYVRNGALQMYYPVLSGDSNVILPGANDSSALKELRGTPLRFNPTAPAWNPATGLLESEGGRRGKRKNRSARKNRSSRKVRSARRCMYRKSSRRANRK